VVLTRREVNLHRGEYPTTPWRSFEILHSTTVLSSRSPPWKLNEDGSDPIAHEYRTGIELGRVTALSGQGDRRIAWRARGSE
jgi:hypothetical protein